jgi:MarR family transcriptional regulator, organic hydroperoxide resistance regulator
VPVTADAALAEADRAAAHLEVIGRALRQSILAQVRRLPLRLTPPQVLAMQLLVDHARDEPAPTGLSLSQLSERMGLAHSTVSGIVTRLERHGLVRRTTRPDDRRYAHIAITEPVRDWVERDLPALRLQPLATALGGATDDERAAVLRGLATLQRLIEAGPAAAAPGPPDG